MTPGAKGRDIVDDSLKSLSDANIFPDDHVSLLVRPFCDVFRTFFLRTSSAASHGSSRNSEMIATLTDLVMMVEFGKLIELDLMTQRTPALIHHWSENTMLSRPSSTLIGRQYSGQICESRSTRLLPPDFWYWTSQDQFLIRSVVRHYTGRIITIVGLVLVRYRSSNVMLPRFHSD